MTRKLIFAAVCLFSSITFAQAQAPANSPIKITGIEIEKNAYTPEFTIGVGPQKKAKSQMWLWMEVSFTYSPAGRNAPPLDDLKFNYYVLLNDASATNRTGTLLVGSVTHTGISPGGPGDVHHSVMLVSPQVLKRFFGGKLPANMATATQAIGVTATVQGQIQGELSTGKGQGRSQWWTQFQQGPPGLVLSKDQTPFAPLFYDYFEATKPQAPGAY